MSDEGSLWLFRFDFFGATGEEKEQQTQGNLFFGRKYEFNAVVEGPATGRNDSDYRAICLNYENESPQDVKALAYGINRYLLLGEAEDLARDPTPEVDANDEWIPTLHVPYLGNCRDGMYLPREGGEFVTDNEDLAELNIHHTNLENPRLVVTETGRVFARESLLEGQVQDLKSPLTDGDRLQEILRESQSAFKVEKLQDAYDSYRQRSE